MKMIVAFVQPFMAHKVVTALHEVQGLSGATFTEVRGFGRGRAAGAADVTEEDLLGTVAKVRVEVMVPDRLLDRVVRAVHDAAHTGHRGDGKIYVLPLERALRIGGAEEGEGAV
ncbi:MAG: P-II family nitrogen regulator [Planctomycetes bacterium]|nr:P-II family nitrogen regulator [Planctomycetota bacterium]